MVRTLYSYAKNLLHLKQKGLLACYIVVERKCGMSYGVHLSICFVL